MKVGVIYWCADYDFMNDFYVIDAKMFVKDIGMIRLLIDVKATDIHREGRIAVAIRKVQRAIQKHLQERKQ